MELFKTCWMEADPGRQMNPYDILVGGVQQQIFQ